MTQSFNRWMLVAIVLIAVPFWWLLIANGRDEGAAKPVHIADLRQLAAIIPGQRPTAISATVLGKSAAIGDLFAGGIGLKRRPLAAVSWILAVPGKGPVFIDPDLPPLEAGIGQLHDVDRARLDQIAAAATGASLILRTQGAAAAAAPPGAPTQDPYLLGGKAGMTGLASRAALLAASQPRSYTTAQVLAPGVVAIPATSHAADARLIFLQLADGREFLFAGTISPLSENWSELRLRSHLAEAWGPKQNREETAAWLRTIRQLHSEAPQLQIVPGYDGIWMAKQFAAGTIAPWQPAMTPAPAATQPRHGPGVSPVRRGKQTLAFARRLGYGRSKGIG